MDGDPRNDGVGLNVGNVKGIKVVNSEFEQLGRGAMFDSSTNVTVANNMFHELRSDGLNFSAVTNVLIDGNSFTNFHPISADHPDAIQFWTANTTKASTDIVIRNNVMLQGSGDSMQGIFMWDEVETLPYQRVTIQNNLVYEQNWPNGVVVYNGKDVNITGNTLLSPSGDATLVGIRANKIDRGIITRNVADQFNTVSNTNVSVTDNLLVSQSGISPSVLTLGRDAGHHRVIAPRQRLWLYPSRHCRHGHRARSGRGSQADGRSQISAGLLLSIWDVRFQCADTFGYAAGNAIELRFSRCRPDRPSQQARRGQPGQGTAEGAQGPGRSVRQAGRGDGHRPPHGAFFPALGRAAFENTFADVSRAISGQIMAH